MKYKELLKHSESCQLAADEMAFNTLKITTEINILAPFQSFCDFNLFWLYSIAPEVILHIDTVEFFLNNREHLKRKLTIKEMLRYDLIFGIYKPETFNEFKKHVT